jgi:hypothetical protein
MKIEDIRIGMRVKMPKLRPFGAEYEVVRWHSTINCRSGIVVTCQRVKGKPIHNPKLVDISHLEPVESP